MQEREYILLPCHYILKFLESRKENLQFSPSLGLWVGSEIQQ